jgi:hypothetical protein
MVNHHATAANKVPAGGTDIVSVYQVYPQKVIT